MGAMPLLRTMPGQRTELPKSGILITCAGAGILTITSMCPQGVARIGLGEGNAPLRRPLPGGTGEGP